MLAHTMTSRTRHLRTSLEHASSSLIRGANIAVDDRRKRLASLATQLDATSPLRCLDRGYSVAIDLRLGRAVMDANSVEVGDELEIRLRRGKLRARTESREL